VPFPGRRGNFAAREGGELFLNYMIHAGQPHPFGLLVVRLDLDLTDEEIVVHVREVLERQVGQALAQVRRGQA